MHDPVGRERPKIEKAGVVAVLKMGQAVKRTRSGLKFQRTTGCNYGATDREDTWQQRHECRSENRTLLRVCLRDAKASFKNRNTLQVDV